MPVAKGQLLPPPSRSTTNQLRTPSIGAARRREEFRTQANYLIARLGSRDGTPRENISAGEPVGPDTELAAILDAIAEDVARMSAGASAAAMAEFAGAIDSARKQYPKHLLAGIIRSLKETLQAKLATIKEAAKIELAGRREAAIRAHRGRFPAANRKPPDAPNLK